MNDEYLLNFKLKNALNDIFKSKEFILNDELRFYKIFSNYNYFHR